MQLICRFLTFVLFFSIAIAAQAEGPTGAAAAPAADPATPAPVTTAPAEGAAASTETPVPAEEAAAAPAATTEEAAPAKAAPAKTAPTTETESLEIPPPPEVRMKRRTGLLITGAVMMGVGAGLAVVGLINSQTAKQDADLYCNGYGACQDQDSLETEATVFMVVGGVIAAVGIPLFIVGLQKRPVSTGTSYSPTRGAHLSVGPAMYAKETFGLQLAGAL
ncbi:MAG TPA: hypothetical protein VHO25_22615 [Polyangiaceae bacterium]|nr:hypothetical protein [Polyangiaceae bacterium]